MAGSNRVSAAKRFISLWMKAANLRALGRELEAHRLKRLRHVGRLEDLDQVPAICWVMSGGNRRAAKAGPVHCFKPGRVSAIAGHCGTAGCAGHWSRQDLHLPGLEERLCRTRDRKTRSATRRRRSVYILAAPL